MRRILFSAAALALISGAPAYAQGVTVPLPSRGSPTPAPTPPDTPIRTSPQDAQVPLPGSAPTPPSIPIGIHGRPDINPYERDIDMTVPLMYRDHPLGDLPIRLTFDDQFFVQTKGFVDLIRPQLNPAAQAQLLKTLGSREMFTADDLAASGVSLVYDPSSLSIVVLSIDPERRAVERLFAPQKDNEGPPDIGPARYSGYMNFSLNQAVYENGGKTVAPTLGLNGAFRLHNIVFETEGSFSDTNPGGGTAGSYTYERTYARLVYDQPDSFRRWFLGDLTPEVRGEQGFVQMAGIGVLRSRLPFNDFRSAVLQNNRQIVLQRDSDVSVMRNGVLFEQLHLRAGSYDLSSLPLLAGSNDVQIQVKDNTGASQNIAFQSYLDPIDLAPGDYEYGAYLGPISQNFGSSPSYHGPFAFSGFYRKAYVNRPALGFGLQLSKDVQNLTGQTQFLLPHGARLLLDAGASNSKTGGRGFAVGAAYEQEFDRGGLTDSLTVRADYLSRRFAGLSSPDVNNTTALTASAQYSRAFSQRLTASGGFTFVTQRDNKGNNYRADAALNYSISRHWSVRAGIDYAHFSNTTLGGRGFGGTFSLIWQPNVRTRAEARYDSSIDSAALSINRADSNQINSFGYGGVISRDSGQYDLSGFADYTANRFTASVAHSVSGGGASASFGSINVTSITVGTTLAFADHAFGVGRRVNDSFAILYPHPSLHGRRVVAGESLANNNYIGESGPLGGALNNALAEYTTQSVQYTVINPPIGYDIGPGVVRVKPPYRSGYAIQVGADSYVTAMGTLVAGGSPITLIGGRVVAVDRPDIPPTAFFTNSVGRFGVLGLRPGIHYRVDIYTGGDVRPAFEFTVPKDSPGLLNLNTVPLKPRN